jgi:hypothetical protein
VLLGRIRKSGKVVGYNRVGRSLIGKRSGKLFRQDLVNPIRYVSRHDLGSCSGNMPGYDSGKVSGSNSNKESGMILDKDPGKHPDENLGKVIWPGMNV